MRKKDLEKMSALLTKLIQGAEEMERLASHDIETQELHLLQTKQETLLSELKTLDLSLPHATEKALLPLKKQIEEQLTRFETLNRNYLKLVSEQQPFISFEETT